MKNLTKFLIPIFITIMMIAVACKKDEPTPTTPTTPATKSTAKDLTKFSFAALSPVVDATIDATTKVITATVPAGTDITKLVPTITISDKSTVSPATGVAQDFSKEVSYTVTAEDGTTQKYAVTVTKTMIPKSTAKNILTVVFNGTSPEVKANVDTTAKTISGLLPAGTDVTTLVPTIIFSDKATISPASGVVQDFSKEVLYTVTAEDGSTKVFSVKAATDAYYFSNIRMTVSETTDKLTDSCLINYRTGQVFQLKDGPKYADQIDGLLNNYCGLEMYSPAGVLYCGVSCGVGKLNSIIVGQKWSTYRKGNIEKVFANDGTSPSSIKPLLASIWNNISFGADISKLNDEAKLSINGQDIDSSMLTNTTNDCIPTSLYDKILYRIITQDGKKGILRMKQFGKKGAGYYIVFDIKIQK